MLDIQSTFHFVQNTVLISIPKSSEEYTLEDFHDLADKEISKIALDKDAYKVRDENLEFDVLLRHGEKLYYFSYEPDGKFKELEKITEVSDGFFGFRAEKTAQDYSHISVGSEKFYLETHPNTDSVNLTEIAEFIKTNYLENFELWEIADDALESEDVKHHIRTLFGACQHMFIIRKEGDNQIVAMRGLTVTPEGDLGFRSIAVTKEEYRGNGLAATIFQQMVNQYPNAVFIGYISNEELHNKLSLNDMIQPGENNMPVSQKINLKEVKPISSVEEDPAVAPKLVIFGQ